MAKTMISAKRKKSSKKLLTIYEPFSSPELKNAKLVMEVLIDALMSNDLATFQDVLIAHLRTVSKSKLATKTKIGRQTLYDLINEDKEFNPTLSTLGSLLKAIAA
ncbi:MAG: hypothetical protein IPK04_15550 [Bdellovibrionales bacterium]|nr:hypothetical protein [Bdellovibrionales bacterium]